MQNKTPSKLFPPNGEKKVLLHSCCAPCSGNILERMVDSEIDITVFYYNPNIYPQDEYEQRKKENKIFALKLNIPFIDADYDQSNWLDQVQGMENEPERGKRCSKCFDIRMQKSAQFANENGFNIFATSLGISRWKDLSQVNNSGITAAKAYTTLTFWDFNWRKEGGSILMYETSQRERFYRQKYCGCMFSLQSIKTRI
ncbi:MAG: epoxyqueuosine reductase QueH [Candidatus Omnitrophica bacterium]|nr:epoxyqueuosine reductase QueH [Candidatus Omnitrophota bacterium]MBU1995920.1 epoxyqueuosine reductase QueH [Candidatus Omnitrophota bacterium]MBU4334287.1 epoxyqueuosine reductase QueH [Candidatus Omnitrophota bacterium]